MFFAFFFFQITSKVQRFDKFWWLYQKNHIKLYKTIWSFYWKKDLNLIKKEIISSEKMKNSGNCNYDYTHSFFGKDFFSKPLYWFANNSNAHRKYIVILYHHLWQYKVSTNDLFQYYVNRLHLLCIKCSSNEYRNSTPNFELKTSFIRNITRTKNIGNIIDFH